MALKLTLLGLFLSQTLFAKDLVKIADCKRFALTVKETAQVRSFFDNQIQFMLGQKKQTKGEPVDVLMMTYGNYCRILYGIIETDLKDAVPVANSKLGQYTVMLDVGMSFNEGYVIRKVVVTFYKSGTADDNAIDIMISKLP